MRDSSTFGHRLKQLRQEHGLTQDTLAEHVGCATQTIRKIENGHRRPSYQMAARLADVLGIGPDERASFIRSARDESPEEDHDQRQIAYETVHVEPSHLVSLPIPLTRLIGREQEVTSLQQFLRRTDVRLLTLSGAGGAGKTRLSLEVAAEMVDVFADGVVFVNLVPIRDPELVVPAIAAVLGIGEEGGRSRLDRLKDGLRAKRLLLVLDNFEQVMPAAPAVAELLAACPGLKVLATSREVLRIRGERVFPVPPLPVPVDSRDAAADELTAQYPAVQLFVERAQAVNRSFAITAQNVDAVSELCRRLDGLPLAIELAAARSNLLSPEAMLARLGSRLRLLTGGARDMPARQQTLRDTIAWSYDLLTDSEQKLLRRLSVFIGGRALDAIETVCTAPGRLNLEIVDGLASLVDKSLLWQDVAATYQPWFLMLETIWEYGQEQLEQSGEAEATRRAHAGYYLQLVGQAERHLWGGDQEHWTARLAQEHDNLRAALRWYMDREEGAEAAIQIAGLLWRFWDLHGHWTEGQQWLEQALSRRASASPTVTWIALHGAGNLALNLGEYARARIYYEESLVMTRQLQLQYGIANSLLNLSMVECYQGNYREAIALQEESHALHREADNNIGMALTLHNLASMLDDQGDYERATILAEESLARYRKQRDSRGVAMALQDLALVAHHRGAYDRARMLLAECWTIYAKLEAKHDLAAVMNNLGELDYDQGEDASAKERYEASLRLATELGDRRQQATVLNNLGRLALRTGDPRNAAALCARSLALHRDLGDKRGIALALESLGQIALDQAANQRAASFLKECLALAEAIGDRVCIARCLRGLAEAASVENQPEHNAT